MFKIDYGISSHSEEKEDSDSEEDSDASFFEGSSSLIWPEINTWLPIFSSSSCPKFISVVPPLLRIDYETYSGDAGIYYGTELDGMDASAAS